MPFGKLSPVTVDGFISQPSSQSPKPSSPGFEGGCEIKQSTATGLGSGMGLFVSRGFAAHAVIGQYQVEKDYVVESKVQRGDRMIELAAGKARHRKSKVRLVTDSLGG